MSLPFNIGVIYPCGAGIVICTEATIDHTWPGERRMSFTLEAHGEIFRDLSEMPPNEEMAQPRQLHQPSRITPGAGLSLASGELQPRQLHQPSRITRRSVRNEDGTHHAVFEGQSVVYPAAARTPACLADALLQRGRFIQAPPPGGTGA